MGRYDEISIPILNNDVKLDIECWACNGGTKEPHEIHIENDGTCGYCKGIGYVLTDAGLSLMRLTARHIKLNVKKGL